MVSRGIRDADDRGPQHHALSDRGLRRVRCQSALRLAARRGAHPYFAGDTPLDRGTAARARVVPLPRNRPFVHHNLMQSLFHIPATELARIRGIGGDPVSRTAAFAAACRINTLYMITRAGSGHIGTSFSCMDIVSWLFLNELRLPTDAADEADTYFSSKGHDAPALYSVLIGLGLLDFDRLHHLRRLGGLPGHPDVSIPFMQTNTGPLGMGISK